MIETLVFYGLITVNLILALGLVWLVASHRKVLLRLDRYRDSEKRFEETQKLLDEIGEKFEEEAQVFLSEEEKDAQRVFKTISEVVKEKMMTMITDFEKQLGEEAAHFQEEFSKRLDQEFAKVAQEIESYRKKQMGNVDKEVRQLVVDISREALGRTIEPKDHEEMVRQALEKLT